MTLPFAAAEEQAPPEERGGPGALSLEGLAVLLAEDNEINMEIADEMLTSQGAHVTRAWNGEEAVERFREAPPFTFDAVLLDMQMPVMDGCDGGPADPGPAAAGRRHGAHYRGDCQCLCRGRGRHHGGLA